MFAYRDRCNKEKQQKIVLIIKQHPQVVDLTIADPLHKKLVFLANNLTQCNSQKANVVANL